MNSVIANIYTKSSFTLNQGFTISRLYCIAIITLTKTYKNEAIRCDFGRLGCEGACSIRNSKCGDIMDGDVISCGCLYCNFDNSTGTCFGVCPLMNGSYFNSLNTCRSRIEKPKEDRDCVCSSCKTNYDSNGKIKCAGRCFKNGQRCKLGKVPAYTENGYIKQCFCQ